MSYRTSGWVDVAMIGLAGVGGLLVALPGACGLMMVADNAKMWQLVAVVSGVPMAAGAILLTVALLVRRSRQDRFAAALAEEEAHVETGDAP